MRVRPSPSSEGIPTHGSPSAYRSFVSWNTPQDLPRSRCWWRCQPFSDRGWGVATTSGWLTSKLVPHRLALGSQPPSIRPIHPPLQQTKLGLQPRKSKTTAGFETKLLHKQKTYRCVCGGIAAIIAIQFHLKHNSPFDTTWNSHRKCLASKAGKGEGSSLSRFAGQTLTQWKWHHIIILIIIIITAINRGTHCIWPR